MQTKTIGNLPVITTNVGVQQATRWRNDDVAIAEVHYVINTLFFCTRYNALLQQVLIQDDDAAVKAAAPELLTYDAHGLRNRRQYLRHYFPPNFCTYRWYLFREGEHKTKYVHGNIMGNVFTF